MICEQWPCGPIPEKWQRPELRLMMEKYGFDEPRQVVSQFEKEIAEFAGSKYAVAVDSCTNAIFLSLTRRRHVAVSIPKHTYISVPMAIINAGIEVYFDDMEWSGAYELDPAEIWDGAVRWTEGMYKGGFHCLSFQAKKRVPIGKGGMILTDSKEDVEWFKQARFEGRHEDRDQWHDEPEVYGWNMYMTPEDAARGLMIFHETPRVNPDSQNWEYYPDLSELEIFRES